MWTRGRLIVLYGRFDDEADPGSFSLGNMGVFGRILGWFRRPAPVGAGDNLDAERTVQELRLQVTELKETVSRLKADLQRVRDGHAERLSEELEARMERVMADAAAPLTQLNTQKHLLEFESKAVQARDVLAVAGQLIRLFEDAGITLDNCVGETVGFDPDRHTPLGGEPPPVSAPVVVRFAAVTYRGKVLHKAGVQPQ